LKTNYGARCVAGHEQPDQPIHEGQVTHKHQWPGLVVQRLGHGLNIILGSQTLHGNDAPGWFEESGQDARRFCSAALAAVSNLVDLDANLPGEGCHAGHFIPPPLAEGARRVLGLGHRLSMPHQVKLHAPPLHFQAGLAHVA
jgi:hypothetical protein